MIDRPFVNRKRSPYDLFREHHWNPDVHARVGSPAHIAERNRIVGLWAATSDVTKAEWGARARASQDELDNVQHAGDVGNLQLRRGLRVSAMRKLAETTLEELQQSELFEGADLGMCSGSVGLAPTIIDEEMSNEDILAAAKRFFSYDDREVENPPGTRIPTRCCKRKYFGLCGTDHELRIPAIQTAVYNVYTYVKRWAVALPSFFSLAIQGAPPCYYLMTHSIGTGQVQLLVHADKFGHGDDQLVSLRTRPSSGVFGRRMLDAVTSQMELLRLLDHPGPH